jgi:4-amino-4-deoxy-L-arabinose transferase-like glycosyltransferase
MNTARRGALPGVVQTALLCLAVLGATAWVRPLMLPDEGRYVGVAWEMLRSGDWLTPTLNGLPYFHKPPLFYWITAASMALFGANEAAARAAPLLGATAGAVALWWCLRRWADAGRARAALAALLAQPLFFVSAQFANLDMLVAGCITATIVLLADAALCMERQRPYRAALAGAYAAAAFGVLAKGLIGALIPALVIAAWLLWRRRVRVMLRLAWWPGALLFATLTAPWFVVMQQRHDGFAHYFFVVQHVQRFSAGGFNNAQPFWFYPALLLLFCAAWSPWIVRALRRDATEQGPLPSLALCWAAAVVLFFSLPQSKLVGYVLPALPPLALLVAEGHARSASWRGHRALWVVSGGAVLLSCAAVVALAAWGGASSRDLGLALRAQRQPGEPLFMVGRYDFDVPFYARLAQPVRVIEDWRDEEVARRDNWRKELADAGRFAPARAARVQVAPADFAQALCGAPVSWVIGKAGDPMLKDLPREAVLVKAGRGGSLWRIERRVITGCRRTPNDD